MSNYDERVEIVTERTMAAMHAFWSAMLTAHTVLLSVAVALPAAISSIVAWQFKLVGFIATICMVLVLLNFAAVRMQYEAIGRRLLNLEAELSEAQRARDISVANTRHTLMRIAELLSALGLVVEAALLTWVLIA